MINSTQNADAAVENLHQKFKHYGALHLEYRRKCIGLLPEIYKQKIYLKKGFESIFEYASKLAGLSHEQVKRVLSLGDRFADKPTLKACLENGEVSINKLARIASIATQENEAALAEQIKLLPQKAVETLVRDEKFAEKEIEILECGKNKDGLPKPFSWQNFVRAHELRRVQREARAAELRRVQREARAAELRRVQREARVAELRRVQPRHNVEATKIELDEDVENELAELQQKGIDINELLRKFLAKRKEEITAEKERIAEKIRAQENLAALAVTYGVPSELTKKSRYIPVATKSVLQKEFGTKCSIFGCNKPSIDIHHTQRFTIARNHNPHFMAPLCKEHHQIAHSIDLKYQNIREQAIKL